MKVLLNRFNSFSRQVFLLVGSLLSATLLLAQPANDDCANAQEIIISNNNFALGTFSSPTVDMTNATAEIGTYFLEANDHNKDIWFSFYLPTARYGKLELFQVGQNNQSADLGFITYLRQNSNCPPPFGWIEPAKLTPVPQQGSTETECLDPGMYLVQVTFSEQATGLIYLELTLEEPFDLVPGLSPLYDHPEDALSFNFGGSSNFFDIGCHTIEDNTEFNCFPIADPQTFNQSIWGKFQTGQHLDYLAISLSTTTFSNDEILPDQMGIRIFEGDATQNDWSTLPTVGDCALFDQSGPSLRFKEFSCDLLEANSTYSFAIYFPGAYSTTNVVLNLCQRGGQSTGAPIPVLSQMAPANNIGVLSATPTGVFTYVVDTFTCASSLALSQNQCGTVNPPNAVYLIDDAISYELKYVSWVYFTLEEETEIAFSFQTSNDYRFIRMFNKEITQNCSSINVSTDLFAVIKWSATISCIPPGAYALQVLGGDPPPEEWDCNTGNLGKRFRLKLKAKSELSVNHFSLSDPFAYEQINDLNPMTPFQTYYVQKDTFGCRNTVQIAGGTCTDRPKIMVRELIVDEPGVLLVKYMDLGTPPDFKYKLYRGSISALAAAQNAYLDTDIITGAIDHLDGCIEETGGSSGNYYCVTPGQYSLVAFGGEEQRNIKNAPTVTFLNWSTNYDDPNNPEALGDLTDSTDVITNIDNFSCNNNPLSVGGLGPCIAGDKVQQLYRTFYLSEPRIVRIVSSGSAPFNLFQGDISNPNSTMIPWQGLNVDNETWVYCSTVQQTSDCDMLPVGYYTIVTYGMVPDYNSPSLDGTKGKRGDLGKEHYYVLTIIPPEEPKCNLPSKTCFANDGDFVDWDHSVLDTFCPLTQKTYFLDTMYFNCLPDTPFSDHPIEACDPEEDRTAYYGFKLSDVSFVILRNIPAEFGVKLFDFDATLNPELLTTEDPIYSCQSPEYTDRVFCNVPPGTYTIVIFGKEFHKGHIMAPKLVVERVLASRFDYWANAYDFGVIPSTGQTFDGKVGDVNPLDSDLSPSTDYISCETSASPGDPTEGVCCTGYNELINSDPLNVQYLENTPAEQLNSLRNIIYTFVLAGSGKCSVEATNCINTFWSQRPHFGIYKSDSGSIPFEMLQQNGGIDSTLTNGLTLVTHSSEGSSCDVTCFPFRNNVLSFDKTACVEDTVRYYVVVSNTKGVSLNQQINLQIRHEGVPFEEVQFDEFELAGSAISPDGTTGIDTLTDGFHCGQSMSFQCATANPIDPFLEACDPERTVWYRFLALEGGNFHVAYSNQTNPNPQNLDISAYLKLYQAGIPGDINSLSEIPLTEFLEIDPNNNTSSDWYQGCIDAGEYYLFWSTCDGIDIFDIYRPCIYFESHPGDFCSNAVPIDLPGEGTATASVTVDCHTIGTDVLDGPDSYECLLDPEGYKSSFFVLNLTGPDKRDVTFSMEEFTSADPFQIRYRVLPGYCSALTPGLCSPDPNTSFTLNCLGAGSYIIQVVTVDDAVGNINFTVTAVNSLNQDCIPLDPLAPNAWFDYDPCRPDSVYFTNLSTFGEDIAYEWIFPEGSATEKNPVYAVPASDVIQTIAVTLKTRNIVNGLFEIVTINVEIPPYVEPIEADIQYLCPGNPISISANSYTPTATFNWSTGEETPSIIADMAGEIQLEVNGIPCPLTDTVLVVDAYCDSLYLEVCDSLVYGTAVIFDNIVFTDTISAAPNVDTLREVTAIVNGIGILEILPNDLEIELGDVIELSAYTNATSPIYRWSPEGMFDQITDRHIRATPLQNLVFGVWVEDSDGCRKWAEAIVNVNAIYDGVYFPNAFSPNGDGINDYFFPFGANHVSSLLDFRIYNRWGALVFEKGNGLLAIQSGWDGRHKGQDAPTGVYTFFARIEYIDGVVKLFEGDVTVVR